MHTITEQILAPATGVAITVAAGDRLRVTDLEGGQVIDMVVFNADNPREKLSLPYSRSRYRPEAGRTFYPGDKLLAGDILRSTIYGEMMRIVEETPEPKGVHGVDGRMCNRHLYEAYGQEGKDGCQEIIAAAIAPHGLLPEDIPDCMDLFMNYHHDCAEGRWVIGDCVSKPGDYIEFEALMDCLVAMSNCPYFPGKPMKIEVLRDDG
ncbi:MAG: urea carboxylase-associated family protein [Pseudomonadota bacterium]|nr:urea carboxylase-associated family protein [Pseudomonadota bacterium]